MRILIDECLDWRLCRALSQHQCVSVHQMKWNGLTNGMLLQKAQHEFDVFVTADRNLTFQQNLTTFKIAVIVLKSRSTLLIETVNLMPEVAKILTTIQEGQIVHVGPTS